MSKKDHVAAVADLPLSLLGEDFQRFVSLRRIAQVLKHDKAVEIAKSVL